jgi:hypothetical protein
MIKPRRRRRIVLKGYGMRWCFKNRRMSPPTSSIAFRASAAISSAPIENVASSDATGSGYRLDIRPTAYGHAGFAAVGSATLAKWR